MIYQGRLVASDLAMSFLIPPPQEDGQAPVLVRPRGVYGKLGYLPPEVRRNRRPFDPFACDLWSSMVTLFNMATGERMYDDSIPEDLKYILFVLANGCSRRRVNNEFLAFFVNCVPTAAIPALERNSFLRTVFKISLLSDRVLKLFEGVIQEDPQQRWNLAGVQQYLSERQQQHQQEQE
jgi:serine/threonine protein kinase